jgi:hypothetical protein
VLGGYIYTSTDSGETWTQRARNRYWRSITSSADGTKLAAVEGSDIYRSYLEPLPTVTAIVRDDGITVGGTPAGGNAVTITGTNLTWTESVTIGGRAVREFTVVNSTTITCITPEGTPGGASVLVTTSGGRNAANTLYTYGRDVSAPAVVLVTPASRGAVFTTAKLPVISGTYSELNLGSLTLALNGGTPVTANPAALRFSKSYASEAAALSAGIVPGPNTVVLTAKDLAGNVSTITRSFRYDRILPVTVSATNGTLTFTPPLGGTAAARTAVEGQVYQVSARAASSSYIFGGYSGTASITNTRPTVANVIFAPSSTSLVASFIDSPFSTAGGASGVYSGVVQGSSDATDTQANAGAFKVAVALNTGAFTGSLRLDGVATSLAGLFTPSQFLGLAAGTAIYLSRGGNDGLGYDLTLDLSTKVISASITKRVGGEVTGVITATLPQAHKTYTPGTYSVAFAVPLSLSPDSLGENQYPRGHGYGILSVNSLAAATQVGVLADGTAYTSSTVVCQPSVLTVAAVPTVPVYASFAGATGALVGTVALQGASVIVPSGRSPLRWFQSANSARQYYPAGFASGAHTGLHLGVESGYLRSGTTPPVLRKNVTRVRLDDVSQTMNLTTLVLSIGSTTHVLAGTYKNSSGTNRIGGIVVGTQAYGYLLTPLPTAVDGTGQGGRVTLE